MYRSARSARVEPLLFHRMTRCHSVFSCCSPDWFFHRRLVASERVATRDPFEVLRTSGSAPRFPIRMTLFRLRLTGTSRMLTIGSFVRTRIRCRPVQFLPTGVTRRVSWSRRLMQRQTQHQGVLPGIPIIRRPLPHWTKPPREIQRLGRAIRFAHLEKDLGGPPA